MNVTNEVQSRPRHGQTGAVETNGELNWLLHRGIKSLLRCDEAEVVREIARYVIAQYPVLRVGSEFVERRRNTFIAPLACFLGAVTRFLEIRRESSADGATLWVARLNNERRAIEPLIALLPELNWNELTFHRKPSAAAVFALIRELLPLRRRIFRLTRRLLRRRQKLFKVLRVAELVGYYIRYLHLFKKGNCRLAVMSSHSNPHGIAFNLAARRCGVPVVLITHGMPVRPVARLVYDIAVLHCEAARRTYLNEGCQIKEVLIHGRKQDYAPMPRTAPPSKITVGVFLCKDVAESRLVELIETLLNDPRIAQIIIRPHPKNLWRGLSEWVELLNDSRIRESLAGSSSDDLAIVDVVFGGNSSVLIEAVTAGCPGVYVAGIDHGSADLHHLVKSGLICAFDDRQGFDPNAIFNFYRQPDWIDILRDFANIDQTETAVAEQLGVVLRRFADLSESSKSATWQ